MTHKTPAPLPTDGAEPDAWQYRYRHNNQRAIWTEWGDYKPALSSYSDYTEEKRPLFAHPSKPQIDAGAVTDANACHFENCGVDREAKMVAVAPGVFCDPCIAPLVKALNVAGIATVASCCGHGHRPGMIALADGRQLIIARDLDEALAIGALFPTDINGAAAAQSENGK